MIFGEKLVILRKKAGLSQEDLAFKLDVSRQAVYKWESGQSMPDIEKLKMLSTLFDVSIDNFLNDKEDIFFKSNEQKASKKLSLGKVTVSEEKIEDIDVEKINKTKTENEKRMHRQKKWYTRLTAWGSWLLLITLFAGSLLMWHYLIIWLILFLFIGCVVAYFWVKFRLYKDLKFSHEYRDGLIKEAEETMEKLGYTHIILQHDLPAWFFYDSTNNCFGFYFNGKEQFVCPIQNYVDIRSTVYGDGIVSKPKLGASVILGDISGIGVHSEPTYSSSSGKLFVYTITYLDESGQDKEYEYALQATRLYVIERFGFEMDEPLAKETLNVQEKIKTKIHLEKSKLI